MMGDFNDIADRTLLLMRSTDGNITKEQYSDLVYAVKNPGK